jgi:hypothetical protein
MLHKVKIVIALALVPIALFAFCFPSLAQTWTTHEVLSGTKSSISHSIAVHKNGTIYIGFENAAKNKIFLASSNNLGADWNKDTVAENSGKGVSIAINSNNSGYPHLSYRGENATQFAYQNGTEWQQEPIESSIYLAYSTTLKFGTQDLPHVSYFQGSNSSNKVRYAMRNDSGIWENKDVVKDNNLEPSLTSMALDTDNTPHVIYLIKDHLYYKTKDNSTWTNGTEIDNTSRFEHNDISVDENSHVHIIYYDRDNKELLYTRLSDDDPYKVDFTNDNSAIGEYHSLDIDSDNNPHIAYSGKNGTSLQYAYYNGTKWKFEPVVPNATDVNSVSLDLDDEDNAHISYLAANSTLKYATTASISDSNDANGGGGGGGGCLMTPEPSFGAGWLLLLIVPAFALISRRVRS